MPRFNPNAYGNPMAKERSKNSLPSAIADQPQPLRSNQQTQDLDVSSSKPRQNDKNKEDRPATSQPTEVNSKNPQTLKSTDDLLRSRYAPQTAGNGQNIEESTTKSVDQKAKFNSTSTAYDRAGESVEMSKNITAPGPTEPTRVTKTPCQAAPDIPLVQAVDKRPEPSCQLTSNNLKENTNNEVVSVPGVNSPKHKHTNGMASADNPKMPNNRQTTALLDAGSSQALTPDVLSLAQNEQLRRIQLRIRAKEKKDTTTSLRDLDIARMPVSSSLLPDHLVAPLVASTYADVQPSTNIPASTQHMTSAHEAHATSAIDHNHRNKYHNSGSQSRSQAKGWASNNKVDQENLLQTSLANKASQSRWASRDNLRPVEMDVESNACGSSMPSNVSQASNDSIRPLHGGKVFRIKPSERPHPLQGWDGTMQPPPADWDDRPRFDNDGPEFRDDLAKWNQDVCQMTIETDEHKFASIPHDELKRVDLNPDGIGMVLRDTTIDKSNAARYGYHGVDAEEAIKYAQPIKRDDFKDWGKLDPSRPENNTIRTETTNDLVTNWVKHTEERRKLADAQIEAQEQSAQALRHHKSAPNPNKPILSIYLRPACGIDISQMTDIYNWYVKNSPRTAETAPIFEDDMQQRLDDVRQGKLPFLVAIERNLSSAILYDLEAEAEAFRRDPHPIKNIDPTQRPMVAQEKIVGWACAQDFTAADFVERISVELEVYVDPAYRQLGVGKCLMDKLMESCDRGYFKRGGYQFHCPLEHKHLYTAGGGRDLHKLMFVLRKWKYPKHAAPPTVLLKHVKANPKRKVDDQENDYDVWLKKWLEAWNFEVEGVLKGAGAKNGRFIDLVHLSRETRWQPTEGRIPEPMPGF